MSWVASVYHRLAFRGLLAEGLGELGLHQPRVLSLAAWSLSNAGDATRDAAAATPFAVLDLLGVRQQPAWGRRSSGWASWRWAVESSWLSPPARLIGQHCCQPGSRHSLRPLSASMSRASALAATWTPTPSLAGPPPRVVVSGRGNMVLKPTITTNQRSNDVA